MKTAALVILAAMVAATSWAQPGPGGGGGMGNKGGGKGGGKGHGFNPERMAEELGLTEAQLGQMQNLQHEWQVQLVDLRAASQKTKLELRRLMRDADAKRDDIIKAVEADGAADLAMAKARAEHFLKMREVLGPEKAATMVEMRHQFGDDERGPGSVPPRRANNWNEDGDGKNND